MNLDMSKLEPLLGTVVNETGRGVERRAGASSATSSDCSARCRKAR